MTRNNKGQSMLEYLLLTLVLVISGVAILPAIADVFQHLFDVTVAFICGQT